MSRYVSIHKYVVVYIYICLQFPWVNLTTTIVKTTQWVSRLFLPSMVEVSIDFFSYFYLQWLKVPIECVGYFNYVWLKKLGKYELILPIVG